jgi:hypothetical protein
MIEELWFLIKLDDVDKLWVNKEDRVTPRDDAKEMFSNENGGLR